MRSPIELDHRPAGWLLAAAAATLAPHAVHLPAWLVATCVLLLAWRTVVPFARPTLGHRLAILAIAAAMAVGVKLHFGHFFGREPGIALLAALLCLKVLESARARDIRAAVLLTLLLQVGLFLHDQTPGVAALALVGSLLAVVTLLSLHDEAAAPREQFRMGAVLLGQGLPFMIALFVLFPRVHGPLWGLPNDAYGATTGLSESMSPGSISRLGLSDAIAFRAEFSGEPPPAAQRYWRGPVLTEFDGRTWRASTSGARAPRAFRAAGPEYEYRITLEPHHRDWVLALDHAAAAPPGTRLTHDHRLVADAPLHERRRFELRAYPGARIGLDDGADILAPARGLPPESNPRARALARRLATGGSHEAILARALVELRAAGLIYTLEPPMLGAHSVDEFLFDTRRGFCEHFASAFVFLMRAAGVPARVVTGYQGGEINPADGTLVVRQSDAHAWAEAWIAGRGWVRVDPTALAAPLRIEAGLAAALPEADALPWLMRHEFAWVRGLRSQWEALSNGWNQWILGYNPDRQRELLGRLGLPRTDRHALVVALAVAAAALLLLLVATTFVQRGRGDALDRAWSAFCRKLARRGVPRHPWEGPLDYGHRAANAIPGHAPALLDIAGRYARLRYGALADAPAVHELAQRIRRLKLQ